MAITAALVKELREKTGAGMMDCKKALTASDGDMEKAIDFLREKGLSSAAKKSSRIAAEGIVGAYLSEDAKVGALLEVNCETDFVANTDKFHALVDKLVKVVAEANPADLDAFNAVDVEGKTVATLVVEATAEIGEKISVRRFVRYAVEEGRVASYIHMGGKIGVLVSMTAGDEQLGKDVAMQIAAANPGYLNRTQVPADVLEHEKTVLSEQARNEGKPEKIIEKMVLGRINKFYKEVCLVDQEFVKDPDQTIAKVLKAQNADVTAFTRFQMGEGLEKRQENFADEVASFMK